MPQTTLLLVRHGQTEWNRLGRYQGQQDAPLNETGRVQAAALAQALRDTPIDVAYSSDLSRAHETLDIALQGREITRHTDPRLREIALGPWEGLLIPEVQQRWPAQWQAWQDEPWAVSIEGGETLAQVQQRALVCVQQMLAAHAGKTILVVSHNAVVRVLLCDVLGLPLTQINRMRSSSTGVNIIHYDPLPSLALMNSVAHLGSLTENAAQATA